MILLSPAAYSPILPGEIRRGPPPLDSFPMKRTMRSDFLFWTITKMPRSFQFRSFLGTPPKDISRSSALEQELALRAVQHLLPISQRSKGMWNDRNLASSIPRYDLEHNSVPTLLMSADDDLHNAFRSAEYAAEHTPRTQFVRFGTGVHILLGHGQEVTTKIADFLRSNTEEHAVIEITTRKRH